MNSLERASFHLFTLTLPREAGQNVPTMKQQYHTIIKPETNGWFVGWVEEIPGTITTGRSLDELRHNLKDSLELMLETHRDEARLGWDPTCLQEMIEVDTIDDDIERIRRVWS